MKKVILEEIENMKYLLGYKRGVVISEQQTPQLGTIQPSNKSAANMFKDSLATANQMVANNPFAPKTETSNTQTAADIYNEFQRQQGPAAQIYKDFQSKYQQQTPSPTTATGTTSGTTSGTTTPESTTPVTPIKIGVKYPSIEELQNTLNTKFQSGLTPDGKYGPKTAASVLAALQKAPTNTAETNTPPNIVVGGDASSEAIKKAAEANASTNVAANNNTNNNTNNNSQQQAGGNNFAEVDGNEFS